MTMETNKSKDPQEKSYEDRSRELKHDAECLANQSVFAEETWGCFERLAIEKGKAEALKANKSIENWIKNTNDTFFKEGKQLGKKEREKEIVGVIDYIIQEVQTESIATGFCGISTREGVLDELKKRIKGE